MELLRFQTSENFPESSEIIPDRSGDFSENSDNLAEITITYHKFKKLPNTSSNFLGSLGNFPESLGDFPESSGNFPVS